MLLFKDQCYYLTLVWFSLMNGIIKQQMSHYLKGRTPSISVNRGGNGHKYCLVVSTLYSDGAHCRTC